MFLPVQTSIAYAAQSTTTSSLESEAPVNSVLSQSEVMSLINKYSSEYNVNADHLFQTIKCESHFDSTIQSGYFKNGVQEQSFGLSQINLLANPDVTLAQADNPDFSVRFMAQKFSQGFASHWSCWNELFG